MQDKTRQVGFEWENDQQVWDKVEEEISEFKFASASGTNKVELEDEFGDILFSLINYAKGLILKLHSNGSIRSLNAGLNISNLTHPKPSQT